MIFQFLQFAKVLGLRFWVLGFGGAGGGVGFWVLGADLPYL